MSLAGARTTTHGTILYERTVDRGRARCNHAPWPLLSKDRVSPLHLWGRLLFLRGVGLWGGLMHRPPCSGSPHYGGLLDVDRADQAEYNHATHDG
jgi:hypothetical protein